jgi:hypothetical protein
MPLFGLIKVLNLKKTILLRQRKYSFIGDFEKIVSGRYPEYLDSFEERTRKIWKKQVSDTD